MCVIKRWVAGGLVLTTSGILAGCNEPTVPPPPAPTTPVAAPAKPPVEQTGAGTSQPDAGSSSSTDSTLNPALQQQSKK